MSETILYLSAADIRTLDVSPRGARESATAAFRDHARGLNKSLPKGSLDIGPGHGFQGMIAASEAQEIATMKWVSMSPVDKDSKTVGTNTTILVNDYATGQPLAIMDGNEITLLRTAAMSASAASFLVDGSPRTIGLVGSGLQARAHLSAFVDLFPGLERLIAVSRTRQSAEKLVLAGREKGLDAKVLDNADELLMESDIIISTVPGVPGLKPFLDARKLKERCFVSAVDIGRSWLPESLTAFDLRVTDSLSQSRAPYDVHTNPVETAPFHMDLVQLCGGMAVAEHGRKLFCFRGYGIADMALASLVLTEARKRNIGLELTR